MYIIEKKGGDTVKVAIAEFRAHMSKYLGYVSNGQVVVLTSHGNTIAELRQPDDSKKNLKNRLDTIAAKSRTHNVTNPVIGDFMATL